jgi:hypothetical protein
MLPTTRLNTAMLCYSSSQPHIPRRAGLLTEEPQRAPIGNRVTQRAYFLPHT